MKTHLKVNLKFFHNKFKWSLFTKQLNFIQLKNQ